MEILARYTIDEAAHDFGIDREVIFRSIASGKLSLALDISSFGEGFTKVLTNEIFHSSDWIEEFEDVLDEDSTAYGYVSQNKLLRYENYSNPRFEIAEKAKIRTVDYFTKYPSGYLDVPFYEQLYRVKHPHKMPISKEWFDDAHTFSTFITREALRHWSLTSHLFSSVELPELHSKHMPSARELISGLRSHLGDENSNVETKHLHIIKNLLKRIYLDEAKIAKAPTIRILLEKQGINLNVKTIRGLLPNNFQKK